jgi:hypothetical protein
MHGEQKVKLWIFVLENSTLDELGDETVLLSENSSK